VAVGVGRKQVQEGWVGVDQVLELEFVADRQEAVK
jgi:hypothetical protein